MNEDLQEMAKSLETKENVTIETLENILPDVDDNVSIEETEPETQTTSEEQSVTEDSILPIKINLTNFYDWFEENSDKISLVSRVRAEVSNINAKDNIILKVQKGKDSEMELISFYNPAERPVLNLIPLSLKVFKNDTFEALHYYSDEILFRSYGVKTGLICVCCFYHDQCVIPISRCKVKKNATEVVINFDKEKVEKIKNSFEDTVNIEDIQILYSQAIKNKNVFSTKINTIKWFLERRQSVVDINHLLKIDNVLINIL